MLYLSCVLKQVAELARSSADLLLVTCSYQLQTELRVGGHSTLHDSGFDSVCTKRTMASCSPTMHSHLALKSPTSASSFINFFLFFLQQVGIFQSLRAGQPAFNFMMDLFCHQCVQTGCGARPISYPPTPRRNLICSVSSLSYLALSVERSLTNTYKNCYISTNTGRQENMIAGGWTISLEAKQLQWLPCRD
jgi:hypothetical protein